MKRLTLNLGVRWDYETQHAEHWSRDANTVRSLRGHGHGVHALPNADRRQVNLFVPLDLDRYIAHWRQSQAVQGSVPAASRLLVWGRRGHRTTVFGGWGIYYDRIPFDVAVDEKQKITHPTYTMSVRSAGSRTQSGQVAWNDSYLTADQADARRARLTVRASRELWLIDNEFKVPQSTQWSVGIRQTPWRVCGISHVRGISAARTSSRWDSPPAD